MFGIRSFNFITLVILVVNCSVSYCQTGCTLSYKTDLADKEPVLLTKTKFGYDLFQPTTQGISLKPNDEIVVSCPGATNKIIGVNKNIAIAKCDQSKKITIDGKPKELKTLGCEKRPTGQTLDTSEVCGKTGFKKYIGHKIDDKWYQLFHVCYDQKQGQTLYSKHTLQGASINSDKQDKIEGNFKVAGLDFRVKPEQIYMQANLKKKFAKILDSPQLADQYINAQSTLIKSQLSPKSDFVYTTSQYIPHFYINTIPLWQQINSGNWKTVEDSIRKTASNLNDNFKIITGTYDVLTLKNKNNQETKVYLDEMNTLPVPKFVYKIVYSLSTKKAIVFVVLNNPFVKSVSNTDYLCNDVCDKNGWGNSLFKQVAKGLVYCCDVKQFMEKVKNVANVEGDVVGVLDGKTAGTKAVAAQIPGGCLLNYKTDFPEKEPILLKKNGQNYELWQPQNDGINLKTQEEITLFCPGSSNKIAKVNKNLASLKCASGKMLKYETKPLNFKELGCNTKVITDYRLTKTECLGKGLIKEIGHKIDDKNFITLLNICYDHKEGTPLYSEHVLYGSAINSAKQLQQNIDYKVAGLEFRVNAEEDYKNANQKALFEKLLESKELATKYINTNSYLARAHLSPSADFVFSSSKYSSYFYINTLPQWQAINNGNWKSLENAIRSTAASLQQPFEVITGGFGVLSMKNSKGKETELYLDVLKTLPVPKFIWKIMYSENTKKGIVFVSLNNPFVDSIHKEDYICPNICNNYGWSNPEWDKKERGLIYCCDIKEFVKVMNIVPDVVGPVTGVQEAKKK